MTHPFYNRMILGLGVALIAACDCGMSADVDDDELRDQTHSEIRSVEEDFDQQRQQSEDHIDGARGQVEAAIDRADEVSEDALDVD